MRRALWPAPSRTRSGSSRRCVRPWSPTAAAARNSRTFWPRTTPTPKWPCVPGPASSRRRRWPRPPARPTGPTMSSRAPAGSAHSPSSWSGETRAGSRRSATAGPGSRTRAVSWWHSLRRMPLWRAAMSGGSTCAPGPVARPRFSPRGPRRRAPSCWPMRSAPIGPTWCARPCEPSRRTSPECVAVMDATSGAMSPAPTTGSWSTPPARVWGRCAAAPRPAGAGSRRTSPFWPSFSASCWPAPCVPCGAGEW